MTLFNKPPHQPPHQPQPDPHALDDARYPVQKSEAEWREQLDAMQFQVARKAATERPFSGRYWDHWANGDYHCVGCGQALFESEHKFDAGCGWPSWDRDLAPGRVERITDNSLGMARTELRCARCGSHLGHVFPDGPETTGERFCINSASIDFVAKP